MANQRIQVKIPSHDGSDSAEYETVYGVEWVFDPDKTMHVYAQKRSEGRVRVASYLPTEYFTVAFERSIR